MPWRDWISEPIDAVRELWGAAGGPKGPSRTTARVIICCFTAGFIIGLATVAWLTTHGGV
jgi:hypothetical protein